MSMHGETKTEMGGAFRDPLRAGRTVEYHEGYEAGRADGINIATKEARAAADEARETVREMKRLAETLGQRLALGENLPLLVDAPEAARLLSITKDCLHALVSRGQLPRAAVKRAGRRVQFVRARLIG